MPSFWPFAQRAPHAPRRLRLAALLVLSLLGVSTVLFWKFNAMPDTLARHTEPDLPRFTELPAFDPYRKSFTCKHEAQANPPATEQAQTLFEEAMALSDWGIPRKERNYKKVASLYRQAMGLGHWKAQFNLAGLYLEGDGVDFDPNQALSLTEDLMRKGVPAAWFNMGNFYMSGTGPLKQDATVAYAFWQRAAEMGSMHAQALLGKALDANADRPPSWWANRVIGRQMLECAFAQGSGEAAYQLGLSYSVESLGANNLSADATLAAKAVNRYHEGVKFGSQESANAMFAMFAEGSPVVGRAKDPIREDRYFAIAEYLRHHPDTRLPNLDRVLPLPPAKLPTWDGEVESLIKAAQAVRETPRLPATPNANAPGRAHMPAGHSLFIHPDRRDWAAQPIMGHHDILSEPGVSTGLAMASFDGYYQPYHVWATHPQSRPAQGLTPNAETWRMNSMVRSNYPPLHYRRGEALSLKLKAYTQADDINFANEGDHRLVYWYYRGTPRPLTLLQDHLAQAGQVQAISQASQASPTLCQDGAQCPVSGIWQPEVTNAEHPLAKVFNHTLAGESWRRQAFVRQGQPLPSLATQLAPVLAPVLSEAEGAALKVKWRLMAECEVGFDLGFGVDLGEGAGQPSGA